MRTRPSSSPTDINPLSIGPALIRFARAFRLGGILVLASTWLCAGSARAVNITGTVTDSQNAWVVGVEVSATVPGAGSPTATTVTSGSGTFLLGVPAGIYDVKIMPAAGSGLAITTLPAISVAQNTALQVILIRAQVTWSAVVLDQRGNPVPNQQIDIHETLGPATGSALTAADGSFAIQVPSGRYDIQVRRAGSTGAALVPSDYSFSFLDVDLRNDLRTLSALRFIRLPELVSLDVTVQDALGNRIAGAAVSVQGDIRPPISHQGGPPDPLEDFTSTSQSGAATTDGQGQAHLEMFTGHIALTAIPPAGLVVSAETVPVYLTRDTATIVELPAGVTWSAVVLDGRGTPVPNVQIDIHETLGPGSGSSLTAADGSFAIQVPPGDYEVHLRRAGSTGTARVPDDFAFTFPEVRLRDDPHVLSQLGLILLPQLVDLDVTVQDALGNPIAGAAVSAQGGFRSPFSNQGGPLDPLENFSDTTQAGSATTDGLGQAQIQMFTGQIALTATPPAGSGVAAETVPVYLTRDTAMVVELPAGVTWSAVVLDWRNTPVPNVQIDIHETLGPGSGSALTAADGSFDIQVPPGEYEVQVRRAGSTGPALVPDNFAFTFPEVRLRDDPRDLSALRFIRLPDLVNLDVTVQDTLGHPIAGVAVSAQGDIRTTFFNQGGPLDPLENFTDTTQAGSATTDGLGRARIGMFVGHIDLTVTPPSASGFRTEHLATFLLNRATQLVIVMQAPNLPPVANAGPNQIVEATSTAGASVVLDGSASSDPDDPTLIYLWKDGATTIASGVMPTVTLSLGTHTITLTVIDTLNALDTDQVVVQVRDTTVPTVTCPGDMTVEASGAAGATAIFAASASDLAEGTVMPDCIPASGSTFALGATTVICTATDGAGNHESCSFLVTVVRTPPTDGPTKLRINEWLAENQNGIVDPADGQHDDWFEIYNPGPNAANLGGCYLTDSLSNKFKFQVPTGFVIRPGGHLLVWADNHPEQNTTNSPDLHVNLKVCSANAGCDGMLGLAAPDGTVIDTIIVGAQPPDVSEGRWPEGGTNRYSMTPTPRVRNAPPLGLADVTQPGDPIVAASGNSPGSEGVANAIDNQPTKYLNFDKHNAGFTITPRVGPSIVRGLTLTSANDAPERDPASFTLEGSDNGTNFTFIASNSLPPFSTRLSDVELGLFANNTPYRTYRLNFPTVANEGSANSLQIAEVQLLGVVPHPNVVINEWLADNRNGIVDPTDGQHDDWFELYNPGPDFVDLGGYFLTDSLSNKFKFQIPAGYVIAPAGFLLVWADNQPEENDLSDLHVNFLISQASPVDLGLFAADGTAIDAVRIGSRTADVSEGRWPDGGTERSLLSNPTPGAPNALGLSIHCPPDITTYICGSSVVVNYSYPTVSGGSFTGCYPPSGSVFFLGTTLVHCTAHYSGGPFSSSSDASCTFAVTVAQIPPVNIVCPSSFTLNTCGPNAVVNYPSPFVSGGVLNGCLPPSGSVFNLGTTLVTCTAANQCSSRSCTFSVTLNRDITPPVLICGNNKTVECGTAWSFDAPTATDTGCASPVAITVISTTTNVSGCSQFITQTWMATDCCGNSSTCTQLVTVVDTTPPVLNCPSDLTVTCTDAAGTTVSYSVGATDLCDPNVSVLCVPPSGSLFMTGTTTVHCSAGDACGNSNTCAFTVTVTCCASIVTERVDCPTNSLGDFTYTFTLLNLSGTNAGFLFVVPLNPQTMQPDTNCVSVSPGFYFLNPPLAPGTSVPLTVTLHPLANCGSNVCLLLTMHNETFAECCSFTHCITLDATPPVLTCATNKTVECGTAWNFDPPTAIDACCGTNVTLTVLGTTTNGSACLQTITRSWQATDCRANASTCSQTVTVRDTSPPMLTCATNKTVECGTAWNFDPPTTIDACCRTNVTLTVLGTITNGVCAQVIQRTWRAMDCCSNSITCTQMVTVVDTSAPMLTCPSNLVVACTNPAGTSVSYSVTATDLCSTNVLVACAPPSGSLFPAGATPVQCAAIDVCGNRATCTFAVMVACPCALITNETVVSMTNGNFLYSFDLTNLSSSLAKIVALVPSSDCFSFQPPLITLPSALATGEGTHLSVTVMAGTNCPTSLCFVIGLHNSNLVECCSAEHCVTLTASAPVLRPAAAFSNNTFCLSLPTQPGVAYVVEYKDSLSEQTWHILTTVTGDGGMLKVIDPTPAGRSRYYRVGVNP